MSAVDGQACGGLPECCCSAVATQTQTRPSDNRLNVGSAGGEAHRTPLAGVYRQSDSSATHILCRWLWKQLCMSTLNSTWSREALFFLIAPFACIEYKWNRGDVGKSVAPAACVTGRSNVIRRKRRGKLQALRLKSWEYFEILDLLTSFYLAGSWSAVKTTCSSKHTLHRKYNYHQEHLCIPFVFEALNMMTFKFMSTYPITFHTLKLGSVLQKG